MAPFFTGITKGHGTFGLTKRKAASLREFIQYYFFTSPGSYNFSANLNNFGFTFSPNAIASILTIGNGNGGGGGGGGSAGNGGSSGSGSVLIDVPLTSIAPGSILPYTVGTLPPSGISIGGPNSGGTPGSSSGPNGTFPGLPTYTSKFDLYSFTAGAGGNRGYPDFNGTASAGGGGGAGGLVITKAGSDTPLIFGPTVGVTTAPNGGNAGCTGPGNPAQDPGVPKCGGGGGVGGTGYGAGGGGGGAPFNNWGAVSPAGGGSNGAPGVYVIKVSELL